MRGRGVLFVMPAKAGIQYTRYLIFWIPAFAGMTVCIAENSRTAQQVRGFAPIGMLEYWNIGIVGFGILQCWVNGNTRLDINLIMDYIL